MEFQRDQILFNESVEPGIFGQGVSTIKSLLTFGTSSVYLRQPLLNRDVFIATERSKSTRKNKRILFLKESLEAFLNMKMEDETTFFLKWLIGMLQQLDSI